MSQRKRRIRERSLRQRVVHQKALRRRARLAAARPAAAVVTAAALTMAGGGLPAAASATSAGTVGSAAPAAARGTLSRPAAPVMGAAAAGCGSPRTPRSDPGDFADVAGRLFFTASDGVHGDELWTSDGTKAGTVLVKDIKPGARDGGYGPSSLTAVGGKLFFTADDGTHGPELWTSDGTRAGTVLVKDIRPGGAADDSYAPDYLTAVGGKLFFTADDGTHGPELWTSDGTRAGTVLVKDIKTTGPRDEEYGPSYLTAVGGKLFFTADDGIHGSELWTSDGSKAGTVLVKDINPTPRAEYDYGPSDLTDVAGTLYFATDDGTHGNELWTSNGTEAGTVLVKDIHPDAYDSAPYSLTDVGGRLFFSARDGVHGRELWTSNGTEAGTVLVKDVRPAARPSDPSALTGVGGTAVLLRRRRHQRGRAVDLQRHRRGHRPGQGHQPGRRRQRGSRRRLRLLLGHRRCGEAVLHRRRRHPRPGAVDLQRHRRGHRPGQGRETGRPQRQGLRADEPHGRGRHAVLRRRATASTAPSRGPRTAPRSAPSWSRTSTRAERSRSRSAAPGTTARAR